MDLTAVLVITTMIFLWAVFSARLTRADLTAPIAFVLVGGAMAALGLVEAPEAPETLRPLVEVTLVWVLFSDAAGVPLRESRRSLGRFLRLLVIGLPLTVLAGWGLAAWLFPALGIWLALLVAAALAPTDAALGLPVVTNPKVPENIRRLITVESGLNDGIATPVVMVAIAGAASAEGIANAPGLGQSLAELVIGAIVGAAVGLLGGWILRVARRRGWAEKDFVGISVVVLALAAYAAAVVLHGNGFVAAFCAGLAFGAAAGKRAPAELVLLEQVSSLLSLLVWLAFGAIAIPIMIGSLNLATVLYAVASLTVVRMVPVALATIGSGLDRTSVLFVGWFGPRGLASLVFALIALEELGPDADQAVAVIAMTVFLSVVVHGLTASPLAARFGRALAHHEPTAGSAPDTKAPDGDSAM